MDLLAVFLAGLTVGGFTCIALQGGLLASVIAAREEEDILQHKKGRHIFWPTTAFLMAKLGAYIILGFILGTFGETLSLSDTSRTIVQLLAGIYMIVIALDLLKIHPIFKRAVIQPPKFLTRLVKNQSKSSDIFAPALLGAMTIFIPCGTTLAMEALAISSGNPIYGAAIMGTFVLGTAPLFLGVGITTTILGDTLREKFFKLAAILVLYFGLSAVNSSLIAFGSPLNWQTIQDKIPFEVSFGDSVEVVDQNVRVENGVQIADITVFPDGYQPKRVRVKEGIPVRLNLIPTGRFGCAYAFTIPRLGIRKRVPLNSPTSVEFTPKESGNIIFSCTMGMYTGVIEVIP